MDKENKILDQDELESRVINLESKLAFQEHTIQELNEVVTKQQTELMIFKIHLKRLSEQLANQPSSNGEESIEPPPPHY